MCLLDAVRGSIQDEVGVMYEIASTPETLQALTELPGGAQQSASRASPILGLRILTLLLLLLLDRALTMKVFVEHVQLPVHAFEMECLKTDTVASFQAVLASRLGVSVDRLVVLFPIPEALFVGDTGVNDMGSVQYFTM